jgi:replicative DNA helicase
MEINSSKGLRIIHISKAAALELRYMKGRMDGTIKSLKTPWKKMNIASMDGLEWGSINLIAGLSGSGKTAILNELETGLFDLNKEQKFAVLSFNFEMLARRLVGRKLSKKLNRSVKQLYSADLEDPQYNLTKEDYMAAYEYCESHLSKFDISYVDTAGTVDQIVATIEEFCMREENQFKGIVVTLDHSILVKRLKGVEERLTLGDLGSAFNELKKRHKILFIIVSQLNREIEHVDRISNPDLHYPQKKDIFGSDSLWQFSDMVLISHRPEMLGIKQYGPDKLNTENKVYWHFLKTRDGEPFIGIMENDLKYNRILEI